MPSTVSTFAEPTKTMTCSDGVAFIERTRRQLERFDALPHDPDNSLDSAEAAAIRRLCDELEADIQQSLAG